jgi:hypothetical protein
LEEKNGTKFKMFRSGKEQNRDILSFYNWKVIRN